MITITGEKEVLSNFKKLSKENPKLVKKGLEDFANTVLRESKNEVPLDKGDLSKSTKTEDLSGGGIEFGYDIRYAARQHEEIKWVHSSGRKAKYLEDPFKSNIPNMEKIVGDFIKNSLH